jgi:hypothetical protein
VIVAHIGGIPIEEGLLSLAPVTALGLVVLRAAVAERVLRVRRRVAARRTG